MSTTTIPVIRFLFKGDFKSLDEALKINPGADVEDYSSANDLATYLSTIPTGLVIASLSNKEDLVQIATLVKLQKKVTKGNSKLAVINFSGDKNFDKAMAKLGILDLVEPTVNTKALRFKIDFWMKSLAAQAKNNPTQEMSKVSKTTDNSQPADERLDPGQPTWIEPLDLEDDIWVLKNESDCKKILGKWLIRLLGPGPLVASWTEVKPRLWKFDIKQEEKELFVPSEGAWYFTGNQKPEFVWKENVWMLTGDEFELYFKKNEQLYSRLKAQNKSLKICKNSLYANTKVQVIIESFDKEMVFKKEAQNLKDLEGDAKGEGALGGRLEGKNKTDAIDAGPLKGKVEGQEAIEHKNLEQKIDPRKEKTYWNNKNTYEELGQADLSLSLEKGEKESGPLQGKTSTDEIPGYYNGVEKKERPDGKARDPRRSAENTEKESGPLQGKTSTDEISGYYDGAEKNKTEKKTGPLQGKTSTDEIPGHYDGVEKKERPDGKARDPRRSAENTEKESGPLKGKTSTDELSGYYDGIENKESSQGKSRNQLRDTEEVRPEALDEKGLEEITKDARVTSSILCKGKNVPCEINDFFDDTIIFMTSEKGVEESAIVQIDIAFKFQERDKKLKLNGAVLSIDDDGEGNHFVTIQLSKENSQAFDVFMSLYEARQSHVNEFLKRARGV